MKKKTEIPFWKDRGVWIFIVCLSAFVLVMVVLDPADAVPPRVSKECCDNWCDKGQMICHRYTKEYVMCKYPENMSVDGLSPVIDFWVYNTTKLCYSDMELLTGVNEVPFEGEGEVKGEVSVTLQ